MAVDQKALDAVRREIDTVDDAIHDLIIRRTKIVEKVRSLKEGEPIKIRPAREARIINRLIERHEGAFPKRELVRIWRELIIATLSFEGPFSVAVYAPEHMGGYWQLARNQYGAFTNMTGHASVRRVIEAVRSGEATVGILPFPFQGDLDPWWRHLVFTSADAPRIIARLPFAPPVEKSTVALDALAICRVNQGYSGKDHSFFAVDGKRSLGIQRLKTACGEAGISAKVIYDWHDDERPEVWFKMVETDDYLTEGDPRLESLKMRLADKEIRLIPLGGYAQPLTEEDLD
ncbi:MAG: chorismate mutase [Magnetospiraceae bacterium]